MRRTAFGVVVSSLVLSLSLVACGQQQASSNSVSSTEQSVTSAASESSSTSATSQAASNASGATSNPIGTVSNAFAEDKDALIANYADKFTQETYTDGDTGLSVTYNLFLPAGYDAAKSYPMVVFIADSSCTGDDATRSLTQGRGALVWASDEWQAANPCIVCVPTYPETILDDHGSYTTTEYVELTKRLIEGVSSSYAVDTNRIYGTGQSMGCMTTLILASEYPDLYAGCMFVDGQWDVSVLKGLESQNFVYFAAEDDENAFAGMSEVMAMFDTDGVASASAQWDGTWSPDQLSAAANELFAAGQKANFISWATGTIDASAGGMGGGMGSASYHMASFDYAYRCVAVMEWLFQQQ
ncbi:MAG: alpha/beta hydrolase-fold protein [Coriobacteriales bacterium]|nr:alpha/beta hydrolase-fold protein [Coriobacteriales bacterium]